MHGKLCWLHFQSCALKRKEECPYKLPSLSSIFSRPMVNISPENSGNVFSTKFSSHYLKRAKAPWQLPERPQSVEQLMKIVMIMNLWEKCSQDLLTCITIIVLSLISSLKISWNCWLIALFNLKKSWPKSVWIPSDSWSITGMITSRLKNGKLVLLLSKKSLIRLCLDNFCVINQ